LELLWSIPSLKSFQTKELLSLLKVSKIRQYQDGECIIKERDEDSCIYFLLSGRIKIDKQGIPLCTIGAIGEIFGEMRIVDRLNRSASVYAMGKTVCLAVDMSADHRFPSEKDAAVAMSILKKIVIRTLSLRLRFLNDQLVKAKVELSNLRHLKLSA
jgi:CRP-like cAMP-binding protein